MATKATPKKERRQWKPKFLAALALSPNVSAAAAAAGISRQEAYKARERDEAFAKEWDSAIGQALDKAEGELYRRAVDGVKKPVTVAGKRVNVTEYSDTLLIFLLKSHRPERYRETNRNVNVNLTPDQLAAMSDAELDRLIDTLARRA